MYGEIKLYLRIMIFYSILFSWIPLTDDYSLVKWPNQHQAAWRLMLAVHLIYLKVLLTINMRTYWPFTCGSLE